MEFTDVQDFEGKARIALEGPSGSGKTYTALEIGSAMCSNPSAALAVLDTENGSASKYKRFFKFKHFVLRGDFHPRYYIDAIASAEKAGMEVLLLDSLTHAWQGTGGVLDIKERSNAKNDFAGWKAATPAHRELLDAIVQSSIHILTTIRTKTEWVLEDVNGKKVPKKIGTKAVQRDDTDYEFDIVGRLDEQHNLSFIKTRCSPLDGRSFYKPGKDVAEIVMAWLAGTDGPAPPVVKATGAPLLDPGFTAWAKEKHGCKNKAGLDVWMSQHGLTLEGAMDMYKEGLREVTA